MFLAINDAFSYRERPNMSNEPQMQFTPGGASLMSGENSSSIQ